jgi:hypothetical protein
MKGNPPSRGFLLRSPSASRNSLRNAGQESRMKFQFFLESGQETHYHSTVEGVPKNLAYDAVETRRNGRGVARRVSNSPGDGEALRVARRPSPTGRRSRRCEWKSAPDFHRHRLKEQGWTVCAVSRQVWARWVVPGARYLGKEIPCQLEIAPSVQWPSPSSSCWW